MTVIAWDGHRLAVDKQATCANLAITVTKARRMPNGEVAVHSGGLSEGEAMLAWYEAGADPERFPGCQSAKDWSRLVVVSPDGRCWFYETQPVRCEVQDDFIAFGSGADFAIGAMAMGASAPQAVEVASRFDVSCGRGVDVFEVAAPP